jgi:hypothetical protein
MHTGGGNIPPSSGGMMLPLLLELPLPLLLLPPS